MDLTYPTEAEEFRKEVRAWLEENLPDGWFEPGFKLDAEAKVQFQKEWTPKLLRNCSRMEKRRSFRNVFPVFSRLKMRAGTKVRIASRK